MNINLHIERLIVDGVNLYPSDRRVLQATVEAELARLLTTEGLPPGWQAGGAVPSVSIPPIELTPNINPTQMGQQIAQAVYRGMSQ
ncbi:MAG TPA: hypothetical protein V6D11_26960 [Waterburya sp.]|jgi:hypothetical protein